MPAHESGPIANEAIVMSRQDGRHRESCRGSVIVTAKSGGWPRIACTAGHNGTDMGPPRPEAEEGPQPSRSAMIRASREMVDVVDRPSSPHSTHLGDRPYGVTGGCCWPFDVAGCG